MDHKQAGVVRVMKVAGMMKEAINPVDVLPLMRGHVQDLTYDMRRQLGRHVPEAQQVVSEALDTPVNGKDFQLGAVVQNPLSDLVQKQWPKAENLAKRLKHVEDAVAADHRVGRVPITLNAEAQFSWGPRKIELNSVRPSTLAHEYRHAQQWTPSPGAGEIPGRFARDRRLPEKNLAEVPGGFADTLTIEQDANRYALDMVDMSPEEKAHVASSMGTYLTAEVPALRSLKNFGYDRGRAIKRPISDTWYEMQRKLYQKQHELAQMSRDAAGDGAAQADINERWAKVRDAYYRARDRSMEVDATDYSTPFSRKYWEPLEGEDILSSVGDMEAQRHHATVRELRNRLGDDVADAYHNKVIEELGRYAPPDVMEIMRNPDYTEDDLVRLMLAKLQARLQGQ